MTIIFSEKSQTNHFWNDRAKTIKNDVEVNIMDVFQRNLEYDHICKHLNKSMSLLEVGCGMGISTNIFRKLVKTVDAFDFAENMIVRAKKIYNETNNKFYIDNVLDLKNSNNLYDAAVCVRVLINLRNLEEQKHAIQNITSKIKSKGLFILVEGFIDGFKELQELRTKLNLPPIIPAKINYYSSINEIMPILIQDYNLEEEFHLGAYDYLTRIVYPAIVGPENTKHNTEFSEKSEQISRVFNEDAFKKFSRIRGLILRKK